MKKSLQDQLLKSGLVDEKKLKKVARDKRKQGKQQGKGPAPVDEITLAAQQALAEQVAGDRRRNRELEEQKQQKAVAAQIVQMIRAHRIVRGGGNTPYQFADHGKIKKLFVSELMQNQLARGHIAIVRLAQEYECVPATIAAKIAQRDADAVLVLQQRDTQQIDGDDPYADYPIPDDLMW